MADQITLRDYRRSDLDAIFRLDEICFPAEFRFDHESMRSFAERKKGVCLIAEAGEHEIVGFVIVHLEPGAEGRRGYVVTLDVAVEFRSRGVARRLMLDAETRAAAAGARWMELHVFTGNEGAVRFYERLGYERVGERKRFYGKEGLDAFLYRKALPDL
jgi:ribosomal-protein-alanine N-acetyltransferase